MPRTESSQPSVNVWKQPNSSSTEESSSSSPSPVADIPQPDKVDTIVRKRPQRRKPVSTGVWPCKIHGCNKQFAREADLKRHQRTTKMHSMPSFSCPQCDATFTRTDALRRHQKSRHNGVVLDPVDQSKERDENARSRSGTPSSSKSKELPETLPVPVTQGIPTPTGPSSYYRSHTANISPYIPPHLQQLPPGPQITHPTSSTRTAPPWPPYLSTWPNGPLPYLPHPFYQPSPHYRPHTSAYSCPAPPRPPPNDPTPNPSLQKDLPAQPLSNPVSSSPTSLLQHLENDLESVGITSTKEITAEEVVAAVEAALRQAACQSQRSESQLDVDEDEHLKRLSPADSLGSELDCHMEDQLMGLSVLSDYGTTSGDLEHILTEDGEPMLNPAELLTQESLASPPPC